MKHVHSLRGLRQAEGRRRVSVVAAAVAVALLLIACGPAGASPAASSSASPGAAAILRVGWVQEPDSLNPFVGWQATSYQLYHMNYDFLTSLDAKTLQPRPELATKWSVSADGTVWTFTIRSGVKWQDDVPLTARDVAFTFNYQLENNLWNLASYTDGITKAVAVDDTTVKIYTRAPKANMLQMIVPIIPEHIWSKVGGKAAGTTFQNNPPVIGSGPFQVVEWQKGKYVRLVANKDYWAGAPKVDEVIFETYSNPSSMVSDLESGTLAGAIDVPMAQYASVSTRPGLSGVEGALWRFTQLAMNCYDIPDSKGNPVLLDQRFRQAVNWAVDREKVVALAYSKYASVGSTLMVPYSPYHWQPPADAAFRYDPAKARQILDDAGYKDVNGDGYRETPAGKKLDLRLAATTDSVEDQTAAKLIAGWLKDVGIKVAYQVIDPSALGDMQLNWEGDTFAPDWDMCVWYWTAEPDPNYILGLFTPKQIGTGSDCNWTSPEYTRLFQQQSRTLDQAKRIEIVQQMQQLFYEAAPYAILAYPDSLQAFNTRDWAGWVEVPSDAPNGQQGSVLYCYFNIDTYRLVHRVTGTTSTGASSGTGGSTIVFAVVVGAVVVLGALGVVVVRRRRRSVETDY
jgi:peptide/nickel transport system substrate-binding protein